MCVVLWNCMIFNSLSNSIHWQHKFGCIIDSLLLQLAQVRSWLTYSSSQKCFFFLGRQAFSNRQIENGQQLDMAAPFFTDVKLPCHWPILIKLSLRKWGAQKIQQCKIDQQWVIFDEGEFAEMYWIKRAKARVLLK